MEHHETTPDIRLIACDMDGTLLNKNGCISCAVQNMIIQLLEHDIVFSIASGRMPHRIDKHISSFLPKKDRYYTACNGAIVICKGEVVLEKRFSVNPYRDLILAYIEKGLEFSFDYDDAYRPLLATERTIKYADEVHGYADPIGVGNEVWKLEVNKISVMDPLDSGILHGFIQGIRQIGGCSPFQYGVHASEIAPENCSKLSGVQYLMSRMHLAEKHVLAIGDHTNDIELLTNAGASAAVGNAIADVRASVDYPCTEAYDRGVIEAIRHYLPSFC